MLLYGPPGLGKTTLSQIIANEMNVNLKITSGPAIEKPGDLAAILTNLQQGDVLFIDEIHRLSKAVEEILYPAMEDFALDIIIGKGPSRPFDPHRLSPVYFSGGNHQSGSAYIPFAGPVWRDREARALYARPAQRDHHAFGGDLGDSL